MRIDYYYYNTAGPQISPPMLKEMLPPGLLGAILEGDKFSYTVAVDANDTEAIEKMDDFLKIGRSCEWSKDRRLEVGKSEINRFSHFLINPQSYDRGGRTVDGDPLKGDVYFNETPPTCPFPNCYWGAQYSGPFEVPPKTIKRLKGVGIGRIIGTWTKGLWLVAPRVKDMFESDGIVGLAYEPCVLKGQASDPSSDPPAYVGRMGAVSYSRAKHAKANSSEVCPQHHYVSGVPTFGKRYTCDDLQDVDIQLYGGVYSESDGVLYRFRHGGIVVTRRALELMLKHKVKGLARMTIHLNEKFLPILLDDAPVQCRESVADSK